MSGTTLESGLTGAGGQRRVLVVDGDSSFGPSLEADLRSRGFEVETAGTPEEAIARVAARAPDLVVLELYLPDSGALKLLRLWKAQVPALVVILVSGHASLRMVVDALNEGARRFLPKPVSAAALIDELEERLHLQQPYLSPLVAIDHRLGAAALSAEGVDRFFAISPGLLSIAGFDGFFKMLNPAWEKALGYTIEELCARPYLELVHPDDLDKATDEALELRGGHTVFRFKNRYRCRDGSYRWLTWSATPSPAHRLIYASARDVTKSVRLEQALRDSNQRLRKEVEGREALLRESTVKNDTLVELGRWKDELAAMIVHDLKNPLSVIVSNYDYVLDAFEGSADCLEALREAQSAGHRMVRLLENLLDVSRLENGTLGVRPAPAILSQLIEPIVEQRRVLARSLEVQLTIACPPELAVEIDVDLATRAVENLLDNALRHTPSGGVIEIDCRSLGPDVEIRIGNSGAAIPEEVRGQIFEKYGQGGGRAGRMNVGLGLYFCRLAVEAQGGTIRVEEAARLPVLFVVRLPRLVVGTPRTGAVQQVGLSS
jgi:PAS domain S-box-containing protein